ncbi:MAG TPA: hypothetical protein PKD85_23315, partial [Saprospiraceae bacterium]|nr:hypothetical protein [Saprospiraceae bacterium]
MKELFYVDKVNQVSISWDQLIKDLNNTSSFSLYLDASDYYELIKKLIISILSDIPIVLIDGSYTVYEKEYCYQQLQFENERIEVSLNLTSKDHLIQAFHQSKDHWSITMFSSGTNGKPKSITHSWLPLMRNVKVSSKHRSNVWG